MLLVIVVALLSASDALAEATDGQDVDCEKKGGAWLGTSGPSATGTCAFPPGNIATIKNRGTDATYMEHYVDGRFDVWQCISTPSSPPASAPILQRNQRCKLLTIDSPLHIGTSASGSWIGVLDTICFRQTLGNTIFINPVAGTLHFESGHLAGEFSSFGLDGGRWEATCMGPAGTFGTAKVVFVK